MAAPASSDARWDQRIARARALADEQPVAREALTFYAALAAYQKSLTSGADSADILTLDPVLDAIPDFLAWLSQHGPAPLAASVIAMRTISRDEWEKRALVREKQPDSVHCVQETRSDAEVFVVEALLQPFAERVMSRRKTLASNEEPGFPARCPACQALPVLAVLRGEGHGAKRTLLCSRCYTEWGYHRILCPNCGQQEFAALPVYTAEQFEHVRIDACSRCQRYIKTIDLSKNGLAVPPVDDIASVALDLWAREQSYVRIKQNLLAL
jgi:FdhE protein